MEVAFVERSLLKSRLVAHLPASDLRKSSHWQYYTSGRVINPTGDVSGVLGFGTRVPRSIYRRLAHSALQRYLLGWNHPVFYSESFAAATRICALQGRLVDMDVLRHCFTIDLLRHWHERIGRPETLCVIGDGQANLVTATLHAGLYRKVISVNLADVLLNDLDLLLASEIVAEGEIQLIETPMDLDRVLTDPAIKLGLVCADQANLLRGAMIRLFVNISSFQEMTPAIVSEYFEIIRSNFASLYCCNRESKVLQGGESLVFAAYPWGNAKIMLDELCPWHQRFYASRPPFVRPYDGPTRHRFATWDPDLD